MTKKLRIKLISPKMSLRPMDTEMKRRMSPSLTLVVIASLTPKPHFVYIEDENISPLNYNDRPDVVGISVNVDTAYRAFEIAEKYRIKGTKVIFGGIHASANPDQMLKHCDAVCIGEAEEIWSVILEDVLHYQLQPKYYNTSVTDMKNYPIPEWDLISKKEYLYHNVVITSRGCPFKCAFCYNSCDYVKNAYRNRPVQNVLDEIKSLKNRQIMFIDDNFIGNVKWTDEFLDHITPLKLLWHSAVSTNLVKYPELINKMAAAGCKSLFIGFESINSASIDSVNKDQNKIKDYELLINQLHASGIMVNSSLVFGFDFDTNDTFGETLEWLIRNRVETMTSHILTPYPGTKLYKKLEEENRIIDFNLRNYNTSNVVFQPKNMTPEELRKGYLNMYKKFYSFKNIVRRQPVNKGLLAPYYIFNLGYKKFGNISSLAGKMGMMNVLSKIAKRISYGAT
jgi:radical SAM superfamily enzyme YgiQ (UPF0313 family)